MKTYALAAFVLAALPAAAQQRQPALDCDINPEDPRCRISSEQTLDRRELAMPRVPVIRDQQLPTGAPDSTQRYWPQDPRNPYLREELRLPKPEPPTEYQEYVEQATGKLLPLFGRDLFRQSPSTFAPADRVPVTPDYTLGPGDQLQVRGWGPIDLNVSPVVDRAGAVFIPQVGEVQVAGLHFAQVQDHLKIAISRVFRNFDLSVNMGQLRSIQVFVMGHARRPGAYTISGLSTLVNAIFVSGGPDARGSMRRIRLTRSGEPPAELDLYDLLLSGDKSNDVRLLPGDVIHIPPVGPQVAISGSVNTPAIYELKEGDTLKQALEMAGGLTPVAASRRAMIDRIEDSSRRAIEMPLDTAGQATPLRSGDIVTIHAIVPRFENTVTLRGNVADPVRMPWRPGMRIRDLIPDREALLTRDYWRSRNQLEFTDDQERKPAAGARNDTELASTAPPEDSRTGQIATAAWRNTVRPLSAGQPVDSVGEPPKGGTPGAIAESKRESREQATNRVERNQLEVNWSYAVIERRNPKDLRTTLIPFNLGNAVLENRESDNLPLEAGDVVTVFSTRDLKVPQQYQTRYVRLEGEFASAGVYSVRPGETLREVVKRAGGLTQQAYLFGSEFTRQATRVEQQQRLDDLVNSLEREVTSAAANVRGSVISPEEAAASASQIEGQRELIRKMREARATGRIVLDLEPKANGANDLPELPLEDGDVFTVPSRPSFVNVVGSVYNGTSFVYNEDKPLGDYLREAGGPTRTADASHAFLIRADGSVVSKSWASRFTGGFSTLRLHPGDSIVVPEQVNKTTFLKGLKDWSQVFAQFGLGAAAINILR